MLCFPADHHDDGDDSLTSEDIFDLAEEIDDEIEFYDDNGDCLITYPEFMRNHKQRIADLQQM